VKRLIVGAAMLALGCGGEDGGEEQVDASPAEQVATVATAEHNTLSATESQEGWELLFDGQTSEGWRAFNGDAFPDTGWAVLDGALVVGATAQDPDQPIGGDIVTTESFDNFDLRFEFRLSPVANSGVFYLVSEPEEAIWHGAPEFQVLDDDAYLAMDDLGMSMEKHLTGDNYDLHEAAVRPLEPLGEWNEGRIVVDGANVEHWLNGERTVAYELWTPEWEALVAASKFAPYPAYGRTKPARIGLQDHGRMVWYRNIKIRRL